MADTRKAETFLDATLHGTDFDVCDEAAATAYCEGVEFCADLVDFHIGINGAWSATSKEGASITSYARIGYTPYSAELLQAVLDSDCAFYVHRADDDGYTKHDMRELQATQTEGLKALLAIR